MHLSPESLAGYLGNDLTRSERKQVELHLAACAECRDELAQVRGIEAGLRRRRVLALVPIAAAAAVVLAIVLPRQGPAPSALRIGPGTDLPLVLVSPGAEVQIASREVEFVWRSAGAAASYSFTLQEADGRVVWSTTTTDTVAALPDSVVMAPGGTWFWSVDALLPDGRSRSAGVQRLSTRP